MLDTAKDPLHPSKSLNHNCNILKKSKELSIFNWFNTNNNEINKNSDKSLLKSKRFQGSVPNLESNFDHFELITIPPPSEDCKGVEGLTQYWNHRITFTNNLLQKQTTRANFKSGINSAYQTNKLKSSNSIGCLVTQAKNENCIENFENSKSNGEHLKSDNFYKYKTADTSKRISFDSNCVRTNVPYQEIKPKLLSNNNCNELAKQNQIKSIAINSFPLVAATERGERIHWAKREDIFINRKQKPSANQQKSINCKHKSNQDIQNNNTTPIFDEKLLNDIKSMTTENEKSISVRDIIKKNRNLFDKKINLMANKKPNSINSKTDNIKNTMNSNFENSNSVSTFNNNKSDRPQTNNVDVNNKDKPIIKQDKTDKCNNYNEYNTLTKTSSNQNQSENGSLCSLGSNSTESPIKKKSQSASTRKYSFKTHTKNFHTPRKMTNYHYHHNFHQNHHSTTGSSTVAKLTAQYNQLIQKDDTFLEEIKKKKNGVILSRGGHVYKIKEESCTSPPVSLKKSQINSTTKRLSLTDSSDDTSSIKSGKRILNLKQKPNNSERSVRATVKKFESSCSIQTNKTINQSIIINKKITVNKNYRLNEKPQVPKKSEIVLKKTKEINQKTIQKKNRPNTIEIQNSNKILEDIKEEARTPIKESKEIENAVNLSPTLVSTKNSNNICNDIITTDLSNSPTVSSVTINDHQDPSNRVKREEHEENETEIIPKKSRYARIYERIRFKNTIFSHKKTQKSPTENNEQNAIEPDKKIREALDTINKKLETLSKSTNDISIKSNEEDGINSLKFTLFNSINDLSDETIPKEDLIQAVNLSLVNKTQSMDDSKFTSISIDQTTFQQNNQILYEPINVDNNNKKENLLSPLPQKSFLFTRLQSHNSPLENNIINKNEYQEYKRSKSAPTQENDNSNRIEKSMVSFESNDSSDIYQSIIESDEIDNKKIVENEKSIINLDSNHNLTEDGYEICEPPSTYSALNDIQKKESEVFKIKQQQKTTGTTLISCRFPETQRNTTDELPAIPEPKRHINLIHKNNSELRPAPPPPTKSPLLNDIKIPKTPLPQTPKHLMNEYPKIISNYDNDHYEDDENIYDTIKGSESIIDCYETLNNNKNITNNNNNNNKENINNKLNDDTISIISNCYESITSIQRTIIPLMNSDSISTISSDHKTNSLYGVSMDNQNCRNIPTHDYCSSDSNDDCWIDISDSDEYMTKIDKPQFIVVREKAKGIKGTEWNTLVHNHRIQMENKADDEDYDSDHFYEPLYPSKETAQQSNANPQQQKQEQYKQSRLLIKNQNKITTQQSSTSSSSSTQNNDRNYNNIARSALNQQTTIQSSNHHIIPDDYDSFDTDDETDEDIKKNDSGVDISTKKLPDPPPATSQVYSFVKRFKNFISNKKPTTKLNIENAKQYENTKFLKTSNEYQNTNFYATEKRNINKNKTQKSQNIKLNQENTDPYENTDFHRPIVLKPTKQKSVDEEILNSSSTIKPAIQNPIVNHQIITPTLENININNSISTVNRRKSKSENSFKSKMRKSLNSNNQNLDTKYDDDTNTLTKSKFYISDSIDLDSGIFEKTSTISNNQVVSNDTNSQNKPIEKQHDDKISQSNNSKIDPNLTYARKTKRNHKSPDIQRRKTTIGIRPTIPPPPPPIEKHHNSSKRPQTSWYAECGVFKASNELSDNLNDSKDNKNRSERSKNTTSWYAEIGLYQTSGASVASSSGSSGVSTGGENCPFDDSNSHSMFSNEPLYQIYSAEKLESISRDMEDQESTDGYEEITTQNKKPSRPTALQLVGPKCGPSRTLWSEIQEVVNSQILSTLTTQEKRLQEAKFEILTSEASYLKSLNLLRTHFMNHPAFRDASILKPSDRKTLFSYLVPVHECSDRLLCDLENCWQDNIMLIGLSHSIFKNAEKYFHVYISFCEHQGKMARTLRRLREQKGNFNQMLDSLEKDPICYGLNLHSFLMLPMQRITRLPLLIDAVFSKVKCDDSEYENWKMTLAILNKIVSQCNEAANRCEQAYEIEKISRQIEFPANLRSFPIAPVGVLAPGAKPRFLVKRGEFIHLLWRGDDAKLTFGKKFSKINIYAFLFNDLLILTKKKSDELFTVFDYCPRNMVTLSIGDSIPHLPIRDVNQLGKNLILMTLLENHEGKTVEMIISCTSVSEQQRWLQACTPPEPESTGEKLYEEWDCPQVIAKHEFIATEPDLLSLEPGDVVNVSRKMPDGWFHGERIRDGMKGWFRADLTEEVNSPHIRSKNLKQRHRLLTFTATYLETQKKNKI